ncbi:MAG: MotA/TolQ/ExbB proton channel family protein [Bdellovibrionales bacterium]|nr:MotA/TolQ/ExbB proton channel family protein [Bdellovibrionales bacterium]
MYFIALTGLIVLLIIIGRFKNLKALSVDRNDFNDRVGGFLLRGELKQAIAYCDQNPTPMTTTVKSGLVQVLANRPDEEVQVAMDGAVLRETPKIEGWTAFLAVFGNVATLIGLLGTIVGLIKGFGGLSNADPAKKAEILSAGISHALNCTAFGLTVAILALLAYGYFQMQVGRIINEVTETSMNIMNLVVSNRDKMKNS